MKTSRITILLVASLLFFAGSAMALPFNTRPIGDETSLNDLQQAFKDIGSSLDAVADQSGAAIFAPTGAGAGTAAYIASISWSIDTAPVEFGIYEHGNIDNRLMLFDADKTLSSGQIATFEFNASANTIDSYDKGGMIDQTTYFKNFGFYTVVPSNSSDYFFTEDDQNNGVARFLTYESKGDDVKTPKGTYNDEYHWYIAGDLGADQDFDGVVFQIESIRPVPEPATIFLFGVGLMGLAAYGRKKGFRRS